MKHNHELKAPENFRARRAWDTLYLILAVIIFLLSIWFIVSWP